MALTYQQFKDHIVDVLWRKADADLIAALDTLILTADAELAAKLDVEQRNTSTILTLTSLDVDLPADYYGIRELYGASLNRGEFLQTTPAELRWEREQSNNGYWNPIYAIEGDKLLLVGPFDPAGDVVQFALTYIANIPLYANSDASWVEDKHLDVYLFAVLKQCGVYLREDDRIQLYSTLLDAAIEAANQRSAMHQASGKRMDMPLPVTAGIQRRGNRSRQSYKVRGY